MSAEKTMRASATARRLISSDASTETPIPGEVRGAYDDGRAYCGYALLQQDAEADGGMWQQTAKASIAAYFEDKLAQEVKDGKIVVMM